MLFPRILILWVAVLLLSLALSWKKEGRLNAQKLGIAVLSASLLTGISVFYPGAGPGSPAGLLLDWARSFIMFTALTHFLTKSSKKESAASGAVFATLLAGIAILS